MVFRSAPLFWKNLKSALFEHRFSLLVTLVAFFSSVSLLFRENGIKGLVLVPMALGGVTFSFLLIVSLIKGIQYFFLMLFRYKPDSPIRFLIEQTKGFMRSGEAFYNVVAIGLLFIFFCDRFFDQQSSYPEAEPLLVGRLLHRP